MPGRRQEPSSQSEYAMPISRKSVVSLLMSLAFATTNSLWNATTRAHAASVDKRNDRIHSHGPLGPNASYQSGPHTRIYITKRSWLDGGTEVLPGDRKFTDYAFPPGYSFARQNGNRPLDRQPLNPPFDLGGYPLVMTPW
jgi:hypothetical protein